MSNKLFTTALAASLVTASALSAMKPAAAFTLGSQLQLNSSLVFFDSDIGPGNQLNALFQLNQQDGTGANQDYAKVGQYGNYTIVNSGTVGDFAPYKLGGSFTDSANFRILSIQLPSRIPALVGTNGTPGAINDYVPGGTPGGPIIGFTGGLPFLTLNKPILPTTGFVGANNADPNSASPNYIAFFFDKIDTFQDNLPSSNAVKQFNIGGTGRWVDSTGQALGNAQINGTFSQLSSATVPINPLTGEICASATDTGCTALPSSSFGGTFIVSEIEIPKTPEPGAISALLALGVLGGGSLLKRKRSV